MRTFHCFAFLLLMAAPLLGQENFGVVLLDREDAHQRRVQFRTDTKTLAATPEWTPGSKEPPISVTAAAKIAMEAGKRRLPKADDISIHSLQLLKNDSFHGGPAPTKLVRWFYVFSVSPIMGGQTYSGESATDIVILMDGKIIEPAPVK
jgi:hypothetical protein